MIAAGRHLHVEARFGDRGDTQDMERSASHAGPPLERPITLPDLLRRGLAERPDDPALVSLEAVWSWRTLDRDADRLARHLLAMGLRPGDRVASLMPNRCMVEVLYIACVRAGLVATPLNYRYMAPEIDHVLDVSEASVLVSHGERNGDLALSKAVPNLPLGTIGYRGAEAGRPSLEAMIATEPPAVDLPAHDPAAPAFIFFTSGSTGSPKGVTHTAETIGWIAASTAKALTFTPEDVFLTASSLSHEGGSVSPSPRCLPAPPSSSRAASTPRNTWPCYAGRGLL